MIDGKSVPEVDCFKITVGRFVLFRVVSNCFRVAILDKSNTPYVGIYQ